MSVWKQSLSVLLVAAVAVAGAQRTGDPNQSQNNQYQGNRQSWQTNQPQTGKQLSAMVDGQRVHFPDVQPMMLNNRVMVPMRGVFEHMGAHVHWNSAEETVTANKGTNHVVMRIGEANAQVNGRNVQLDSPPVMYRNRTMVPLRFISESLGADVDWDPTTLTVLITTTSLNINPTPPNTGNTGNTGGQLVTFASGAVIPFTLDRRLTSETAVQGDTFTATLRTQGLETYAGLPAGTKVVGRVDMARAKSGNDPGVLGLAFERIRLPDGRTYTIDGSLIGLDANSVETRDGRLVAKPNAKRDLKYVGIGAGAGVLVAIATKENILTSALLGALLGYLYEELRKDPSRAQNVTLEAGTELGVRLDRDTSFRILMAPQ